MQFLKDQVKSPIIFKKFDQLQNVPKREEEKERYNGGNGIDPTLRPQGTLLGVKTQAGMGILARNGRRGARWLQVTLSFHNVVSPVLSYQARAVKAQP